VPSFSMVSNSALAIVSRSGARRRGRQDTGGPVVMLMWCTVLWRTSRRTPEGRVRSGNSVKMSSAGAVPPMVFTLGNRGDAVCAGADKDVIPSRILLLRQSTKRPKLPSRSTPIIGILTSATTKRQVKSRRSPRLSVRVCPP
jgi:hypothetical protein